MFGKHKSPHRRSLLNDFGKWNSLYRYKYSNMSHALQVLGIRPSSCSVDGVTIHEFHRNFAGISVRVQTQTQASICASISSFIIGVRNSAETNSCTSIHQTI